MKTHPRTGLLLPGILFLVSSPLRAQRAAEEQIVELSPFDVSASSTHGYMAAESSSGTRYAAPIKDIPFPVQVVTSEFIEKFLAVDFSGLDTLMYTSSM